MDIAEALFWGQQSIRTVATVSGPVLLAAMIVGLAISLLQAVTQVQEMTLVFVPKMLSVFVVMIFAGAFMLDLIAGFTLMIFDLISRTGGV